MPRKPIPSPPPDPVAVERETVRHDSGRFGYGLDAPCICGHVRGEHVFPSGRQCMAEVEGGDDGCNCPGFKRSRRKPRA